MKKMIIAVLISILFDLVSTATFAAMILEEVEILEDAVARNDKEALHLLKKAAQQGTC